MSRKLPDKATTVAFTGSWAARTTHGVAGPVSSWVPQYMHPVPSAASWQSEFQILSAVPGRRGSPRSTERS